MNKYQDALNTLTDWFHSYTDKNGITIQERHITPAYVKAKKTIQELVDKAIPKKPYFLNYGGHKMGNWHCPECEGIINDGDVYCKHCGQRLSWKQNEDEKES